MSQRIHRETTFSSAKKLEGAEEAVEKLRKLGEGVLRAAKIELALGSGNIVQDAKKRCPVRTGKLRDSIKAEDIASGAVYEFSANAVNEKGINYAQFVEFDPRIAHPFLYPAIRANVRRIKKNIKSAIKGAAAGRYVHSSN